MTCFRAGIIVGSGSASFEIMRDLVEKLPIMITPKWLLTKCQPIGISDVQSFLIKCLLKEETYNRNFDIGCDDVLSYKVNAARICQSKTLKAIYTDCAGFDPKALFLLALLCNINIL